MSTRVIAVPKGFEDSPSTRAVPGSNEGLFSDGDFLCPVGQPFTVGRDHLKLELCATALDLSLEDEDDEEKDEDADGNDGMEVDGSDRESEEDEEEKEEKDACNVYEHTSNEWLNATVSLYHHVLPGVAKYFLRDLLSKPQSVTVALLRSEEDIRAERRRKKEDPELLTKDKEFVEKKVTRRAASKDLNDDSSSYSYSAASDDEDEDELKDLKDAWEEDAKDLREEATCTDPDAPIKPKERMVGAISYEYVPNQLGATLLQVTLIGVRLKYQHLGLGSRLLNLVKQRTSSLKYDSLITHADSSAVDFFKKHQFSDDPILNSNYSILTENWDQSIFMSYVGGRVELTSKPTPLERNEYVSMVDIEKDLNDWRKARVVEYSNELILFEKMKNELTRLRDKVVRQDVLIEHLQGECLRLKSDNESKDREFAEYRKQINKRMVDIVTKQARDKLAELDGNNRDDEDGPSSNGRQMSISDISLLDVGGDDENDSGNIPREPAVASEEETTYLDKSSPEWAHIENELQQSVRDAHGLTDFKVKSVLRVSQERFRHRHEFSEKLKTLRDRPSYNIMRLFYCGPYAEMLDFFENGFHDYSIFNKTASPIKPYGQGLYFSRYASRAHYFNGNSGKALLCMVALGNTETVVVEDKDRSAPSDGNDSIIIPGRRTPGSNEDMDTARTAASEEYVIFTGAQALPIAMIEYSAVEKRQ